MLIQEFLNPLVLQKAVRHHVGENLFIEAFQIPPKCTGSPMLTVPVFVGCYYQVILGRTSGKCLCLTQDHFNPVLKRPQNQVTAEQAGWIPPHQSHFQVGYCENWSLPQSHPRHPASMPSVLPHSFADLTSQKNSETMSWSDGLGRWRGARSGALLWRCVCLRLPITTCVCWYLRQSFHHHNTGCGVSTGYVGVGSCGHSCDGRFVG